MATAGATEVLTNIAVFLLIGLILTWVSKKLKISNVLLLTLTGIIIGSISYAGSPLVEFSPTFLIAIAILTLVMVVFDGASRFKFRMVNQYSFATIRVILLFSLFNAIILGFFTMLFFFPDTSVEAFLLAVMFAILMSSTDAGSVFAMLKGRSGSHGISQFLEVESIINTPFIVIVPLFIFSLMTNIGEAGVNIIAVGVMPLLQQIVTGVGAGIIVGVVVLRIMKRVYSHDFSPTGIITAALLAYIIAENLQGSGVLAVATLGLVFGNAYVKNKEVLQEFNAALSNSLILLVFMLAGLLITLEFSLVFFAKGAVLFLLLVFCRLMAVVLGLRHTSFRGRELLFISLNMPKGIAVAVVAFSLSVFPVAPAIQPLMYIILQLILTMIIYSLICATFVDKFIDWFITVPAPEQEVQAKVPKKVIGKHTVS